jgi:histidine triad (HIT) family protein
MTIFERIIQRQIPADIVFEDDEMIAFRDIEPKAPVHILIVPKRHISSTNELTESDSALIGRLVLRASEIAKTEGVAESGYRLVINCNRDGGQSVDHLHLHVLGGRQMEWPPG